MDLPHGLLIRLDSIVTIDSSETNIGFYPRDDYLLIEVNGSIKESLYSIRKTITSYTRKENQKPIAFRGVGQGINLVITLIHLMRTEEKIYSNNIHFLTYSVKQANKDKLQTGIQVVLFPKTPEEIEEQQIIEKA